MANSEIISAGRGAARRAPKDIRVLCACEESQAVCIEFRKLGFDAYSCDIQPCSGGHPEWHIQGDVVPVLKEKWDCIIAFPPCTHLAVSGAAWFEQKRKDGRQQQGIDFFMLFTKLECAWAIENPVGIMSKIYRKPDQIIQPYYFGDEAQKTTCLWLHDLPHLTHNDDTPNLFGWEPTHVGKGEFITHKSGKTKPKWFADAFRLSPEERAKARSKTFPGIAKAMAEQWGAYILCEKSPAQNTMEICHTAPNRPSTPDLQVSMELEL